MDSYSRSSQWQASLQGMVKKDAENGEKILQFLDRKSFIGGLNSKKNI